MKKHLFLVFAFLALMLAGCKDNPPQFQLEIDGNVVEMQTSIKTDFQIATTNVVVTYFAVGECPTLTQSEFPDAYNWVKDKAFANVPNGAQYDITVTGYIEWCGVKLAVNEHWKNNDSLAFNSIGTNLETPVVYLPHKKRLFANSDCTPYYIPRFDFVGY